MWKWWPKRQQDRYWDAAIHAQLLATLPGAGTLPLLQRARWGELTRRFLGDKQFIGADTLTISAQHATTIATLACWPMLNLGWAALQGWHEVVIYPGEFRAERRQEESLAAGLELVHEFDEELAGEAGAGVIVLAWEEILTDLAQLEAGHCVVIHEIAHQFDATSGDINGRPPLPAGLSGARWSEVFQLAFERLRQQLDAGLEPAVDPYAAEAPEEFFAVMVEHYCLRPDWLERDCPDVHRLLRQLFGEIRTDNPPGNAILPT